MARNWWKFMKKRLFCQVLQSKRTWTHKGAEVTAILKCVRLHSPPFFMAHFSWYCIFSAVASFVVLLVIVRCTVLHRKRLRNKDPHESGWIDLFRHLESYYQVPGCQRPAFGVFTQWMYHRFVHIWSYMGVCVRVWMVLFWDHLWEYDLVM